jgi:hypothetical protein
MTVLEEFFKSRPELNVQANQNFLLDLAGKPVTIEGLTRAAAQLRDSLALAPAYEDAWDEHRYAHPSDNNSAGRALFIEKLRKKEVQQAESREYEALIKQVGEKWRGEPLERLREIAEKRRIHGLTASQFKQERAEKAATAPKAPKEYDGYLPLPDYLVLPGQAQATRIDGPFLQALVKADYSMYRRLFTKYGGAQLTDRSRTE